MKSEYQTWIYEFEAEHDRHMRGKCKEGSAAMVTAFPELRQAAGFVYCSWGREQHWWCVTPEGEIVDPTAAQYERIFRYEELDLNDPKTREIVPTGVCPNCGDDTYQGALLCSENCEREYADYVMHPERY